MEDSCEVKGVWTMVRLWRKCGIDWVTPWLEVRNARMEEGRFEVRKDFEDRFRQMRTQVSIERPPLLSSKRAERKAQSDGGRVLRRGEKFRGLLVVRVNGQIGYSPELNMMPQE